jgi:hypothetical protein
MQVSKKILEENYYLFLGQYTAVSRIRESAQNLYDKVISGQRYYYFCMYGLDFSEQQNEIFNSLDNAMHKFLYGAMTLEQLWGVTHYLETNTYGLPKTIDIGITRQQNEIEFLLSYLLDQALYTWRSFLDFYLKYLLFFLTGKNVVNISTKSFKDNIDHYLRTHPSENKATEVYSYITAKVLSKTYNTENGIECWGDLLRSLRDKTTHNKLIQPTIKEKKNSLGFKITWPTIQGVNYAELAQLEFENNAFEMIRELFPVLYEIEWKQGPYKPGMYQK